MMRCSLWFAVPVRTAAVAATVALLVAPGAHAQKVGGLRYLGQAIFDTGYQYGDTTVGGLSGITYDAARHQFYSISDDRSQVNDARFYTVSLDLTGTSFDNSDVQFTAVTTLKRVDGSVFPALSLDPEGIALSSGGDSVYIASEGDKNNSIQPFVNRFSLATGQQQSELPIPDKFAVQPGTTSGIRNNLAFESLTRDGATLTTATENALFQDGPAADVGQTSFSRILTFDLNTNTAGAEYLYETGPVAAPPIPAGSFATNGLVDLLALGGGDYLSLERSFSNGVGNSIRLYQFSLAGATDIRGIDSLSLFGGTVVPVQKTLLFDLGTLGIPLDNLEGLAFGPNFANGDRALVLVSDNNFSPTQFTQFVAFRIKPTTIPEPGSLALTGCGLLSLLGLRVRHRRK